MDVKMILASGSPRRVKLLSDAGFDVEVRPSGADEKEAKHHDIHRIVEENAGIKGRDVIQQLKNEDRTYAVPTVLIAADTLVVMGEKVYGKPRDMEEAEAFQLELGGQEHQVLTGVFLYRLDTDQERFFHEVTGVVLKKRSVEAIRDLFTRVNPLDKAGAYGYQDANEIVQHLNGSETNVIGLPMERLHQELAAILG